MSTAAARRRPALGPVAPSAWLVLGLVASLLPAALVATTPAAAADLPATAAAPHVPVTGIPCYPGSGPRVHVFYAYATGQPDDTAARLPAIRDAVAATDTVFAASAARDGGTRHVRFRTTDDCRLVVTSLAVDTADHLALLENLEDTKRLAAGDDALVLAGPTLGALGGEATQPLDDRAGAVNRSNAGGQIALVGHQFWGDGDAAAAMLVRALGAVQPRAPHGSAAGHCTDGTDPLCYDDLAIGEPLTQPCGPDHRYVLDCGADDYFSAAPTPGSWLATHWNTADSVFLAREAPPATDPVEPLDVALAGVPADGRVGPQTPLTVTVTGSQPLTRVVLVSSRAPGVQPLTLTGSTATGSLRSLASVGPGTLFAVATDKSGRQRRTAVRTVTYVAGATATVGTPSTAVRGTAVPYTVDLDLSGDQSATTRFLLFLPRTAEREPIVLVDRPYAAGTSTYTGTLDSTKLPDGDDQTLLLVLADAAGNAVPGSQTPIVVTVSNNRPALGFSIVRRQLLGATTPLSATVEGGAVTAVRYRSTMSDCAAGRVLGEVSAAPYAFTYTAAPDWKGPASPLALCATAVLADGSTTTIGPVPVTVTGPDSIELAVPSGQRVTVGLNKLKVVLRVPSDRQLRAVQLLETDPLFGKGGHLVLSTPVATKTLPTTVDLVVAPGQVGRTLLYARAVFADGDGEYVRSNAVLVDAVPGPAPTARLTATTVTAGDQVLVEGRAPAASELAIYTQTAPSTRWVLLRAGAAPLDGRYSALITAVATTKVSVLVRGGGKSATLPLTVRSAVTMTATRTGRLAYRLAGTVTPKRAGVLVTTARRTAAGGIELVKTTTAADGRFSVAYRFQKATTLDLFAVTKGDSVAAAGGSTPVRVAIR